MERANPDTAAQKPQAGKHPHPHLPKLNATELRLLDEIANLCRYHARHSPRGGRWCQPGRAWLANRIGVTVWTISRNTNRPRFRALVEHHQQRKHRGTWRTCKYFVRDPRVWIWAHAVAKITGRVRPHVPVKPRPALTLSAGRGSPLSPRAPNRTHTLWEDQQSSLRDSGRDALRRVLDSLEARMKQNAPR